MDRLYSLGALDEEGSRDESRNANDQVPTASFSQVWNSVAATKPWPSSLCWRLAIFPTGREGNRNRLIERRQSFPGRGRPPHILQSLKIQQLLGRMVSRDICAVSVVEECIRCANVICLQSWPSSSCVWRDQKITTITRTTRITRVPLIIYKKQLQ